MNGECRMKIQIFNRLIRHGESFRAPRSVQESIPVRKIYRDGVWLCGGRYSKMWRFQDVNYAVASEADQSEILMRYCSVINAWPDDAYLQVLTNNRRIDPVEFENTMLMNLRGDDMDRLREEYNQIVRERTESACPRRAMVCPSSMEAYTLENCSFSSPWRSVGTLPLSSRQIAQGNSHSFLLVTSGL